MKRKNRFKIDTYKEGGNKSEWISNKISEIMKEGKYPQEQAIAIAYSMYDNRMEDGGTPNSEPKNSKLKNIYDIKQGVYNPSLGQSFQIYYRDPSDPNFNPSTDIDTVKNEYMPTVQNTQEYRDYLNRKSNNAPFTPTKLAGEYEVPKFAPQKKIADIQRDVRTEGVRQGLPEGRYTRVRYDDGTMDYLTPEGEQAFMKMPNYKNYVSTKAPKFAVGGDYNLSPDQNWYQNNPPMFSTDFVEKQKMTPYTTYNPPVQETPEQITHTQPPQFLNPYGGYDTPTMTQMSGYYLGKGDYGKGALAGAGALLGTTRNFFSGMGVGKVQEEGLKKYYEDQRSMNERYAYGRDGGYFQEGGMQSQAEEVQEGSMSNLQEEQGEMSQEQVMQQVAQALQQGVDPNQIIQQLMQIGVPQDQAVQMVQGIMQQLQPQAQSQQEEAQEQPMMQNGGEYLNKLVGKKIKNYSYNNQTGNYDIEFE